MRTLLPATEIRAPGHCWKIALLQKHGRQVSYWRRGVYEDLKVHAPLLLESFGRIRDTRGHGLTPKTEMSECLPLRFDVLDWQRRLAGLRSQLPARFGYRQDGLR